jgi:hypothetical protein
VGKRLAEIRWSTPRSLIDRSWAASNRLTSNLFSGETAALSGGFRRAVMVPILLLQDEMVKWRSEFQLLINFACESTEEISLSFHNLHGSAKCRLNAIRAPKMTFCSLQGIAADCAQHMPKGRPN